MTSEVESLNMDTKLLALGGSRLPKSLREQKSEKLNWNTLGR